MLHLGQEVWATVKSSTTFKGRFQNQGGNIHGNEEKGYQEGCQKEKEVTQHGEAKWPR
jgi:hypothetical protein